MANLKENLKTLLASSLENITQRVSKPVEKLGKEKHADDLCAHFVWKDGEQSVFLCPMAVEKGTLFTTVEDALKIRSDLADAGRQPALPLKEETAERNHDE